MADTCALAVDVGGTIIKSAVVAPDGRLLYRLRRDTGRGAGPDHVVQTILTLVQDLADLARGSGLRVLAAGLAVPGIVDEATGVAVEASNIGWHLVPLRDLVQQRLGVPVHVGHDVRAGALAEGRRGCAQDSANFLFVPIGTGIGGAWVLDGSPYPGAHYAAAEIGHIPVTVPGGRCVCGRQDCLEIVASATSIARRFSEASGREVTEALEVATLVKSGDETATRVWLEAVHALTDALQTATTLFDPALVVLGGGLAQSGALLLQPLQEALSQRILSAACPELRCATLGDEAGCVGAALWALDLIGSPL